MDFAHCEAAEPKRPSREAGGMSFGRCDSAEAETALAGAALARIAV
jgi:hypothetical protein